uniref:Uncharacterized protein n=1 Tax=Euplotes harpa TaxID=151035 RepID=A0A7S3NBP4_9SPIT|mmetsp:Transcript_28545/g.32627  ORF Transcript_28545/g.32627 Transcript_28545/m.32627 type:complete len:105 (+) Transcript_28545:29-343(+)
MEDYTDDIDEGVEADYYVGFEKIPFQTSSSNQSSSINPGKEEARPGFKTRSEAEQVEEGFFNGQEGEFKRQMSHGLSEDFLREEMKIKAEVSEIKDKVLQIMNI